MTKSELHVGVRDAKSQLSRLLDRVLEGHEVVIHRRGEPIARLTALEPPLVPWFGSDRGAVTIADDFDTPLPIELADPLGAIDR